MSREAKSRAGFVAALTLVLWGCAAPTEQWQTVLPQPATYQPATFTHRTISPDVEMYWNCSRPRASLVRMDGIAKNVGKGVVHLLEMELHDVDRATGTILQSGSATSDIILHPDIFSPVQLELQPATADGQVDMLYSYRITSVGIIQTTNTDKEFTARDVCSASQHPNPASPR